MRSPTQALRQLAGAAGADGGQQGGTQLTNSFQTLAGSSFLVNGTTPPSDVGLVTAGAKAKASKAVTASAKFDGEFAPAYQSYAGTARSAMLGKRWPRIIRSPLDTGVRWF